MWGKKKKKKKPSIMAMWLQGFPCWRFEIWGRKFDKGEVKSLTWDVLAPACLCAWMIIMSLDQLQLMRIYELDGLFSVVGCGSTMSSVTVVEVLAIQLVIHQHWVHDVASACIVDKLQYPLCVYLMGMLAGRVTSVCLFFLHTHERLNLFLKAADDCRNSVEFTLAPLKSSLNPNQATLVANLYLPQS
jgi:hypothetical protein